MSLFARSKFPVRSCRDAGLGRASLPPGLVSVARRRLFGAVAVWVPVERGWWFIGGRASESRGLGSPEREQSFAGNSSAESGTHDGKPCWNKSCTFAGIGAMINLEVESARKGASLRHLIGGLR